MPLGLESKTVRVVAYDPQWPAAYALEAERIRRGLETHGLTVSLEHTGSTAVPGLAAKPILDILGGWHQDADRAPLVAALQELGYVHRGEQGIPGREFFRRGEPRQYHLHLTSRHGSFWRDHLSFRDLLRADAAIADAYGALKIALAQAHPTDREAYIDGKTAFVQESLREAIARGFHSAPLN